MRDIPVFTTENGVASLILKQVPYKKEAYIELHSTCEPMALLEECVSFCRAVDAEKIYATGDPALEVYPLHTEVWQMQCLRDSLPSTDAALFPVQQTTLEQWRGIYNTRMADVPNAAVMTMEDAARMLSTGSCYFVHRDGNLLGIGKAAGDRIEVVISVLPGAGKDVLLALCNALSGDVATLQVASENHRAVQLYEKTGFLKTQQKACWYKVFP